MFPTFENEFLNSVVYSLRKRHKSLKHKLHSITCNKVYEVYEDNTKLEKLELDFRESRTYNGMTCRLFVWPDRWVWVDARKATKKGWEWEWTFEGRLLGGYGGRELISAIEEALFESTDENFKPIMFEVKEIWRPLLAKGPISVS